MLVILVVGALEPRAAAQTLAALQDPESGDCRVRVLLPPSMELASLRLLIDETETTSRPRDRGTKSEGRRVEFELLQPLLVNSQVTLLGRSGAPLVTGRVRESGHRRNTCASWDERGVFEPSVFMGVVSDAFAPNEQVDYPTTDYKLQRRGIVRLDARLRVAGKRGVALDRLWLNAEVVYGVRSTDLDCRPDVGADRKSPACDPTNSAFVPPENLGKSFTANVLRASKIEAVFKPHFELFTWNRDTSTPIVFYALMRTGFTQAPNDTKPSNSFGAGAGFLIPGGPFRDSGLEFVYGVDRAYRTNPTGRRYRFDFRFLFNALPGWKDQLPLVPHPSRSLRGLIEVVIDRNFWKQGPDSTQTFLGVIIDLRQLLGTR